MIRIHRAEIRDLESVARWLRSEDDCRLWAGGRVRFPIDRATLPRALEYHECDSWVMERGGELVPFGQLVPKRWGRRHLARILVRPERRGGGGG